MKTWRILTLTIMLVSIGAPLVAGFTNWLAPAVQNGVLALAPAVAAAVVFVAYLNWRARLKRQIVVDARPCDEWATAA
jgi:hypothetical protein